MLRFLINRPIAVGMSLLAAVALGLFATSRLPVSLLPELDIPLVSVQVSAPQYDARQLEDNVMRPLRQQLMQVHGLSDLLSHSGQGTGILRLSFSYGRDMGLAFIEVNEQIDRAMSQLPHGLSRPVVVQTRASDIPVLYVDITMKGKAQKAGHRSGQSGEEEFLELSAFVQEVIRRRFEQLPGVAMADVSGLAFPEIRIIPDRDMLLSMGLPRDRTGDLLLPARESPDAILLHDKQYRHHVRAGAEALTTGDMGTLPLLHGGRLWQLKDLARVERRAREPEGMVLVNTQRAITLAIVKQGDARMKELRRSLHRLVDEVRNDYPEIEFSLTRDQASLLDHTMASLRNSLLAGAGLAFVVMLVFLRDRRAPWLVILSLPPALIISLLFFFLAGMSLNLLSLSGLVLCVGMMIDNAIILTDNIARHRREGKDLARACSEGAGEVFRPLLSSALTTCSVFLPLVFLGGLPGALFLDQARAVGIALMVSLSVAMILVPVAYYALHRRCSPHGYVRARGAYEAICLRPYSAVLGFVLRRQILPWAFALLFLGLGSMALVRVQKEGMPRWQRSACLLYVDWNEGISLDENRQRVQELLGSAAGQVEHSTTEVGRQDFLLRHSEQKRQQSQVYVRAATPRRLHVLQEKLAEWLRREHPAAIFHFREEDNVFDQLFAGRQPPLELRLRDAGIHRQTVPSRLQALSRQMKEALDALCPTALPLHQSLQQSLSPESEPEPGDSHLSESPLTRAGFERPPPRQSLSPEPGPCDSHLSESPLPRAGFERPAPRQSLVLEPDLEALAIHQVDLASVLYSLRRVYGQEGLMVLHDSRPGTPVRLAWQDRSPRQIIQEEYVTNQKGFQVPLRLLLRTRPGQDVQAIWADFEGEYHPVELQMDARDKRRVKSILNELVREEGGFEPSFTGSLMEQRELRRQLLLSGLLALLVLYFILAAQFESLILPVIILLEVPLALAGALLLILVSGASLNIMSMMGMVMMSGIILNDSILKIDTINRFRCSGMSLVRALHSAGHQRLRPILMTSITTLCALIPVLCAGGLAGELQRPLALAVMGGLASGTLVSLFFIPLCYHLLHVTGRKLAGLCKNPLRSLPHAAHQEKETRKPQQKDE